MNIIDQLKKNEKPFGLMSEEMQEKARKIGAEYFQGFVGHVRGGEWVDDIELNFVCFRAVRLRSGYEEKTEIEECEIRKADDGSLVYCRSCSGGCGGSNLIFRAFADPDFAGTKFKPVFGEEIYTELWLNLDVKHDGNHKMTHASHVLFRKGE